MNPLRSNPKTLLTDPRSAAPHLAIALLSTLSAVCLSAIAPAQASAPTSRSCAYDPASGKPNPLGDKAFISISEIEGNTIFTYQEVPSQMSRGPAPATVAQKRELTLEKTALDQARQLFLSNPAYYNELLGYNSETGFAPVNASLTCWSNLEEEQGLSAANLPVRQQSASVPPGGQVTPPPVIADPRPAAGAAPVTPSVTTPPSSSSSSTPTATPAAPATTPPTTPAATTTPAPARSVTVAALPNGSYRFWNGRPKAPVVTDETLLKEGGVLFVFRKEGDRITGNFSHIDGEDSACIFGIANNNTVSGFAYPYSNEVKPAGENFQSWGPSGFLQVRRSRTEGTINYYGSALLDLADFNRINLGPVVPPSRCQA